MPRFSGDNLRHNLALLAEFRRIAAAEGCTPAQLALAWLLSRPGVTAPIVGATKPGHLEDALAATEIELSAEEIEQLEAPYAAHPVRGHS